MLYSSRVSCFQASGLRVVFRDPLIKLAREAADRRFVADVGRPQPAAGQSADMLPRLDEHHALAHAGGLHGGGGSAGGPTVNDDVNFLLGGGHGGQQQGNYETRE